MLKNKSSIIALLVACFLVLGLSAMAQVHKDEVVYARLSATGQPGPLYVVNAFEADEDSQFFDFGAYSEAFPAGEMPLAFSFSDGKADIHMAPGRFAYQGNLPNTALPWNFLFSYQLDGQDISPEDLSGKSGDLTIHLSIKINGDLQAFAEGLTLQISLSLDGAKALDIQAEKATIAAAGALKNLTYVVLPGQEAAYSIKAKVQDFSMPGIQIAGIRMAMDMEMYQEMAKKSLEGNPLQNAVGGMMGSFLSGMQGQESPSFTDARNKIRSLQFVLMGEGIPAK